MLVIWKRTLWASPSFAGHYSHSFWSVYRFLDFWEKNLSFGFVFRFFRHEHIFQQNWLKFWMKNDQAVHWWVKMVGGERRASRISPPPPHLGLKLTIPPPSKNFPPPPIKHPFPPELQFFFRAARERLTLFLWCNNSYLFHNEIYILVIYKMQGLFIFSHLKAIVVKAEQKGSFLKCCKIITHYPPPPPSKGGEHSPHIWKIPVNSLNWFRTCLFSELTSVFGPKWPKNGLRAVAHK